MSVPINILAIESSGNPLSIALLKCTPNLSDQRFRLQSSQTNRSSEIIVPLISEVLSNAGIVPKELSAIAISQGPGSFTSLRVGMSVAKGMALALDLPIVALPTLSLFYRFSLEQIDSNNQTAEYRLALQHSKADEFYYALFQQDSFEDAVDTGYATASEIAEMKNKIEKERKTNCRILIRDIELGNRFFSSSDYLVLNGFTAESMLLWAKEKFLMQDFSETDTLIPLYIKEFEARKSNKVVFLK